MLLQISIKKDFWSESQIKVKVKVKTISNSKDKVHPNSYLFTFIFLRSHFLVLKTESYSFWICDRIIPIYLPINSWLCKVIHSWIIFLWQPFPAMIPLLVLPDDEDEPSVQFCVTLWSRKNAMFLALLMSLMRLMVLPVL